MLGRLAACAVQLVTDVPDACVLRWTRRSDARRQRRAGGVPVRRVVAEQVPAAGRPPPAGATALWDRRPAAVLDQSASVAHRSNCCNRLVRTADDTQSPLYPTSRRGTSRRFSLQWH